MPGANVDTPLPDSIAAGELAVIRSTLEQILYRLRLTGDEVAIGNGNQRELVLNDFPVAGARRIVAYRTGLGTAGTVVPLVGVLIARFSEARLGMYWGNTGANPILLYLSDAQRSAVPVIPLPVNGSWNGLLGSRLWSGDVFAVAVTAPSSIAGGEF